MRQPITDIYNGTDMSRRTLDTLDSGRYVRGPEVERFEAEFAAVHDVDHAIAVSSGTAALHLAVRALGIGEGDEVFVPGMTVEATPMAVMQEGATPSFVDVYPETYTMDVDRLERRVMEADNPRAILPVHLYGQPADMDAILAIAESYDLDVIEDACQAHAAEHHIHGTVGSIGDVGCFSFYPSKNMTVAGDGGMVTTDDDQIARRIRQLRNHGREDNGKAVRLGFNYRMSELHAAIGRVQLSHLSEWTVARKQAAAWYAERGLPDAVEPPGERHDVKHVYHLYVVRVPVEERDSLKSNLDGWEIETGVHYRTPAHEHPAIADHPLTEDQHLPVTESLSDAVLSLPMHPRLTREDVDVVCDAIEEYFGGMRV